MLWLSAQCCCKLVSITITMIAQARRGCQPVAERVCARNINRQDSCCFLLSGILLAFESRSEESDYYRGFCTSFVVILKGCWWFHKLVIALLSGSSSISDCYRRFCAAACHYFWKDVSPRLGFISTSSLFDVANVGASFDFFWIYLARLCLRAGPRFSWHRHFHFPHACR